MLRKLHLGLILSFLTIISIKAQDFAWYVANTKPDASIEDIIIIYKTGPKTEGGWGDFKDLIIIEFLLNKLFKVPYEDLLNKNITEKANLIKGNFNITFIRKKQMLMNAIPPRTIPAAPVSQIIPTIIPDANPIIPEAPIEPIAPPVPAALMADTTSDFAELKAELLEIYKQFLGKYSNETILNTLLKNLFRVDDVTIATNDLDTKRTALGYSLNELRINANDRDQKNDWTFDDFKAASESAGTKINNIKIAWNANKDNIVMTENLLNKLFKYEYSYLINNNLATKKLSLAMSFDNLSKIISNPFNDPFYRSNTDDLSATELSLINEIQRDQAHFKELELVEGQIQKGVTCGSHAIINAWAIEQLLRDGNSITANKIYQITRSFFVEAHAYPINAFINSDEICNTQIPKLIRNDLEITDFKNRINFLSYGEYLDPVGVHYTEKPDAPNWFINIGDVSLMRPQLKALLTLPPHVQHFIYNTGGHWLLASVLQKPGEAAVIYYIDSMGVSPFEGEQRARFALTLYENFVKH